MDLLSRFVNRIDFDSYEDFKENFKIIVPEDFNFGFDVVDVYAKEAPDQEALIWCDDDGNERHFILKYGSPWLVFISSEHSLSLLHSSFFIMTSFTAAMLQTLR